MGVLVQPAQKTDHLGCLQIHASFLSLEELQLWTRMAKLKTRKRALVISAIGFLLEEAELSLSLSLTTHKHKGIVENLGNTTISS